RAAGVVAGDRAAGVLRLRLVAASEVGADRVPVLAGVARPEDDLRAVIDHLWIVRRRGDRRGPLEAVLHVLGAVPGRIVRPRGHVARVPVAIVVARDDAEILAGIDDVGIVGLRDDPAGFAAADVVPVAERDVARERIARALRGPEILHRTRDPVGSPRVG